MERFGLKGYFNKSKQITYSNSKKNFELKSYNLYNNEY